MQEYGTRYTAEILGSEVVIDQTERGNFELLIAGVAKGLFGSAKSAREQLVTVVKEQQAKDDREARLLVPPLSSWVVETTAPFESEE